MHRCADHRHVENDDVPKAQFLLPHKQVRDQIGLSEIIGDDEIHQFFCNDRIQQLFRRQRGIGWHQGNIRTHHVQAVKRKNHFCAGGTEKPHARMIPGGHFQRRKHGSITLPLPEHDVIGVLSSSVLHRRPVQIRHGRMVDIINIFPRLLRWLHLLPYGSWIGLAEMIQ